VYDIFAKSYKQWKYDLHLLYKQWGSVDEALAHPPAEMVQRLTEWQYLCEEFRGASFQVCYNFKTNIYKCFNFFCLPVFYMLTYLKLI
jgi:hypothetical protein